MSLAARGTALYRALKDESGMSATLAGKEIELAKELAAGEDPMEITSLTVNGQSFAGETTTRWELLKILQAANACFTAGGEISTRRIEVKFS